MNLSALYNYYHYGLDFLPNSGAGSGTPNIL